MMKQRKEILWTVMFLGLMSFFLLAGCHGGSTDADSDTSQEVELTQEVEKDLYEKEVVLAGPRDVAPGPEDAFYMSSILSVWEPLVAIGPDQQPAPKLATHWERNEDATEWIFHLKEGVTFHDGHSFDADAVIANYDRYSNMHGKSSSFYTFHFDAVYPHFESIEKIEDHQVKMIFSEPFALLPYNMANFGSAMYSPDSFDETTDFTTIAQGTGPFRLVEHERNQYVKLEANEDYYGEKAQVKNIQIRIIPDPQTRFAALKAEEIMGVLDLGALTPELTKQLLDDDRFALSYQPSTISHYLSCNGTRFPFNDPKMKKALSLAIDRELLVQEFYNGYPEPTVNILNAASPFAKPISPVYDPEKAKTLATEVLGDQTPELEIIVPSWALDRYPYKEQAEYLQSVLSELGLPSSISIMDGAAFRERQSQGDFDISLHIQGLPDLNPMTIFNRFMHSEGSTNIAYSLGFSNERVDELLAQLAVETELDLIKEAVNELQTISAEDISTLPMFHDVTLAPHHKSLKNYEATVYGVDLPGISWR